MTVTGSARVLLLAKLNEIRAARAAHDNSQCETCGLHAGIHRPGCPDTDDSPEYLAHCEEQAALEVDDLHEDYPGQRITGPDDV